MKLKFKKGTKLYKEHQFSIDANPIYQDSGKVLEENFECKMPEKDYDITFGGPREKAVTAETTVHYKDNLYLKVGDASNYNIATAASKELNFFGLFNIKYSTVIGIVLGMTIIAATLTILTYKAYKASFK